MPRYFFHVHDGVDLPDETGTVLANDDEAFAEAIRTAGGLLKDAGLLLLGGHEWRMDVVNEDGKRVCFFTFSANRST